MKRSVFCAVLALCLLLAAGALAEWRGACEYMPLDEETAVLVSYTGNAETLDIPKKLDGYILVEIADCAFAGSTTLREVSFPDSITVIGGEAFRGCVALKRVTLPSSLEIIGQYAFAECPALTRVTFTPGMDGIGDSAFYNCASLMSINLPSSVTRIGANAFCGCSGLASVQLSRGLESIAERAFAGCTALEQVDLPETLVSLGFYAFDQCVNLKRVSVPDSLEYLDIGSRRDDPFWRCPKVVLEVNPDSAAYALFTDDWMPYEPVGARKLARRDEWAYLDFEPAEEDAAWWDEEGATGDVRVTEYMGDKESFTVPETLFGYPVTAIGDGAFEACGMLETLTIPACVTEIGDDILGGRTDVTVVVEKGSVAETYCRDNGLTFDYIRR